MLVKANKVVFIDGFRRRVGEEFEYSGKPSPHLDPLEGSAPATVTVEAYEGLTDEDLRIKLAEINIKTAPQTGRKKLIALLEESSGKVSGSAPAEGE
jgi:hypothetical protein